MTPAAAVDPLACLTERERDVLDLCSRRPGGSRKAAAAALGMSLGTVDWHLRAIYRKLGVDGLPEASRLFGQAERPPHFS